MFKKTILIIIFLTAVFLINVDGFCASVKPAFDFQNIPQKRPKPEEYCFDYDKVLSEDAVKEINEQGDSLKRNFDIDFVVLIVPDLQERDIVEYTADLFSKWEIGQSTQGKKGILILIARKEQKIKIEIGYDLEGIYTDMYVGQVEREILKEFLEQADWERGFLAAIESFLFRIFHKGLAEEIKGISSPDKDLNYYSQGAGAANVFDFGAALKRPLPDNYAQLKTYFSAQPTPELAFERYMELCAKEVKHNNDLTLFTELSNEFWKGWKHTSGQSKVEAQEISGRPYYIKQKDNHAVVFFPATDPKDLKKSCLYFLSRSASGWQVDINTMTRSLRCVGPGWWTVQDIFQPYSEIIMEDYNLVNGFLKSWNDQSGYNHYYILDSYFYDEKEPGVHLGGSEKYESLSNLRRGDSILSVNREKIRNAKQLWDILDNTTAGEEYTFTLLRNGKQMTVKEKFISNPDGFELFRPCLKTPRRWLGVYMVQSLDSEWRHTMKLRDQGKFEHSSLCAILEVYPGSPADKAGLKPNDLIVDYGVDDDNGEIMPYDVIKCLYQTKPGETMELTILRDLKDIMKIKVTPEETRHEGYF